MGRKNFDSIPEKFRPLQNRLNVILTRNKNFTADNCLVFHSFEACLEYFKNEKANLSPSMPGIAKITLSNFKFEIF